MTFSRHTTVGELAGQYPATVRVFQRRRIEFCCGGHHTLEEICRERNLSYEVLVAELEHAVIDFGPRIAWANRPLSELTAHVVEAFHDPLRQELPGLRELSAKVCGHGDTHRHAVTVVHYELRRFEAELMVQMSAEEGGLFPLIDRAATLRLAAADGARLARLCAEAESFHQETGQTLRTFRRITDGYIAPPTACASVRALYRGLQELEALMELHVHVERNVLFSRAAALMTEAGLEKYR